MKRNFYLIAPVRRTAVVLACALPVWATAAPAPAAPTLHVRPVADVPVSGRVTGPDGTGLPGVTVLVRGTTVGTSTNSEGVFSLNVPEGSTLVFSFVGFTTQSAAVTSGGTINVTLQEDTQKLSEVVVVGYGTQQRGSVTGAVSSVSARDIASQPVADATQALQGRAAGVTVTSNGGAPGGAAGTSVRVRGITSAGNNNPLFVVDGFPMPEGGENQLNAISPNDIESIDILKDASATAIYGVRAANGVVIITTKRGKAGVTTMNVDAYRGVQQVWRQLDLLTAKEYAVINNENRIAAGEPIVVPRLRNPEALGEGTNWQDELFRQAAIQNYSLSATGGSEKARFSVSGSYFQQDGTIIGSQFERFTLRANGDVQVNKMLKFGNSISLTNLSDRQITTNSGEYGQVQQAIRIPAIIPLFRPDGYYYEPRGQQDNFIEENPIVAATLANQKFTRNRALTTFFVELEPLKGLRFRTNVGADFIFDNFNGFRPGIPELRIGSETYTTRYTQATAGASAVASYAPSYLIENTLTYDKLFADKHQVTLLVGQSAQEFNFSNVQAYRTGYLNNDLQVINSGPVNSQLANAGTINAPIHLASYFSRLNYEFAGKYLFSAIARLDGSDSFGVFGFFPGVSAGWRISEEEFLKGNRLISNLKVRAGYGRVGNPNNAGRFAALYAVNSGIQYPFGTAGSIQQGAAPTRLANTDLRWENNNQGNFGIDVGFLDNRFEATIDLYNRTSPNLIAPVPVSLVSGTFEPVNRNAASAYNRGIDFSLTSRNVQGSGPALNWSTTLNVSAYKTQLEKLGVGDPYNGLGGLSGTIVRYDEGQPFGSFFGFVADGLFQTPEDVRNHAVQQTGTAPGDIRFKDLNNDGRINADDRTFIGDPNPRLTYGISNNVSWKGFDLNVFLQGSQGNQIYNQNRYILESALYGNSNGSSRVLGRWTGPGTSNDVPRAISGDPNNNLRVSSYYVEDGSYLRIKTLTLGYSLPQGLLDRVGGKQVRLYVSGQNLLTLTKYSGFDPEVGSNGVDLGVYPQPRVFLAGLNIGF